MDIFRKKEASKMLLTGRKIDYKWKFIFLIVVVLYILINDFFRLDSYMK